MLLYSNWNGFIETKSRHMVHKHETFNIAKGVEDGVKGPVSSFTAIINVASYMNWTCLFSASSMCKLRRIRVGTVSRRDVRNRN
jgi:hypothetical protein